MMIMPNDENEVIAYKNNEWLPTGEKCCELGSYKCQVPMAIKGRRVDIDFCISDIVAALNAANIITVASCCGHGKDGSIILEDGRMIIVRRNVSDGDSM